MASILTETADVIDVGDVDPAERALCWTLKETPVVLEVCRPRLRADSAGRHRRRLPRIHVPLQFW